MMLFQIWTFQSVKTVNICDDIKMIKDVIFQEFTIKSSIVGIYQNC